MHKRDDNVHVFLGLDNKKETLGKVGTVNSVVMGANVIYH